MKENILKTYGLLKKYNNNIILNNINMEIQKGDIYILIGENESGKTTLMKIICGLVFPSKGNFELFGSNNKKEILKNRKKIGSIIDEPFFYSHLTAFDNLEIQRRFLNIKNKNIVDELLTAVNLSDAKFKPTKTFSMGMKQRLGLAFSLMDKPEFLILDEPTKGLDKKSIYEMGLLFKKLITDFNTTILISSYDLESLQLPGTKYGFMYKGKLIQEISAKDFNLEINTYLKIITSNNSLATKIISNYFNTSNYKTLKNEIHLYENLDKIQEINYILFKENINILEIKIENPSLEDYFLKIIEDK